MIEIKFIKGDTNTIILGIIILLLSQVNSVFIYIAKYRKYHKLQFASRSLQSVQHMTLFVYSFSIQTTVTEIYLLHARHHSKVSVYSQKTYLIFAAIM